jgi:1-acyl-sn-glycerol-3-phosphate acyltransferase
VLDGLRTAVVLGAGAPVLAALLARQLVRPSPPDEAFDRGRALAWRGLALLGIDLEVLHADRVPATGGYVLMWNQESHLDHLVLTAAMPRRIFTTFNNEVRRVPFYGEYLARNGHVWLDRNDEEQWRPAIASAAQRVRDGECVVVSPEGTRSRDGRLLPMKRGAFILAELSQRPIILVTVIGGHQRMPRGSPVVRAGKMRVVFSEPIRMPDGGVEAWKSLVVEGFESTKAQYAISP